MRQHFHPPCVTADSLWVSPDGVHLGDVRFVVKDASAPGRLEAMLAIACRKRLSPTVLAAIEAAAEHARRGDPGFGNIRLALAGLSRCPVSDDLSDRLAMADQILAKGMTPADLLDALDLKGLGDLERRYNPAQTRVPAGNGRESGRFGTGGGGSNIAEPKNEADVASTQTKVAAATIVLRTVSGPSFLVPGVGVEALAALSTFAVTLGGAAAVFGTLFVPSPNDTSTSGILPGGQGLRYAYDNDEDVLRLRDPNGTVVAAGPRDGAGIFHDADTGVAIGRDIGGTLVFEQASMMAATGRAEVVSQAATDAEAANDNTPRLCPDPITEPDNGASPRTKAYQEQISALVNPQSPLPYGLAMAFFNPVTGKWVRPDDCDEKDGSLIEAKSPGFAKNLKYDFLRENYVNDFVRQARAQVQAAGPRAVRWYFAEQETANLAADAFTKDSKLAGKIQIRVIKAIVQ